MKISVITVTLNCREALQKTLDSLAAQTGADFESVVIDGVSTDGTLEVAQNHSLKPRWISEKDAGIYDAMNKGLAMVTGEAVLFLNAGDYFVGDCLRHVKQVPCLIPVRYQPVPGVEIRLDKRSPRFGMPYCHQGIVFGNKGLRYDLKYRIASDYDFFLRHGYRDLEFIESDPSAYVHYDNRGFSSQRRAKRDAEIAEIIERNFGPMWSYSFRGWAVAKRAVRRVIDPMIERWG